MEQRKYKTGLTLGQEEGFDDTAEIVMHMKVDMRGISLVYKAL